MSNTRPDVQTADNEIDESITSNADKKLANHRIQNTLQDTSDTQADKTTLQDNKEDLTTVEKNNTLINQKIDTKQKEKLAENNLDQQAQEIKSQPADPTKEKKKTEQQETIFNTPKALLCETKDKLLLLINFLQNSEQNRFLVFSNKKLTSAWLQFKLKHNNFKIKKTETKSQDNPYAEGDFCFSVEKRPQKENKNVDIYHFDIPSNVARRNEIIELAVKKGSIVDSTMLFCEEYCHNIDHIQKNYTNLIPTWNKEDLSKIIDQSLDYKPKEKIPSKPKFKTESSNDNKTSNNRYKHTGREHKKPFTPKKNTLNKKTNLLGRAIKSFKSLFK
jgi:hypothetical protein